MSRREKRRQMRRMLAGLFAGAAVFVPAASAAIVHDDPADRAAAIQSQANTSAFVRADGPDGAVVAQPVLRRDAPDGSQPATYSTAAPAVRGLRVRLVGIRARRRDRRRCCSDSPTLVTASHRGAAAWRRPSAAHDPSFGPGTRRGRCVVRPRLAPWPRSTSASRARR